MKLRHTRAYSFHLGIGIGKWVKLVEIGISELKLVLFLLELAEVD